MCSPASHNGRSSTQTPFLLQASVSVAALQAMGRGGMKRDAGAAKDIMTKIVEDYGSCAAAYNVAMIHWLGLGNVRPSAAVRVRVDGHSNASAMDKCIAVCHKLNSAF